MNNANAGRSPRQFFLYLLNKLNPPASSVVELRNKVTAANSKEQIGPLLEEIKFRIDICLETRSEEDKHYYYLLRAYCYLLLGKPEEAINATTYAIDGFRVCGFAWEQVIGHWFLGTIYATQRRGYLYLAEIKRAIGILEPIQQDFLIKGEYDEANKCQDIKVQLEISMDAASKMGTGPLYMPGISIPIPAPPSSLDKGYLVFPWLPQYHAVRAGPEGIIWAEPLKERHTFVHKLEIEGKTLNLHSVRSATTGHQITLTEYEQYGVAIVEGNSMNASRPAPICHGDYILFRIHSQPQDNDIVVASRPITSGEFAYMVKRYCETEKELLSETHDATATFPPVKLNQDHQILGIVIAVAKTAA